jgi:hypothetical protein
MSKSIVSMGQTVCQVCGIEHSESVVLQSRDITHPKLGPKTFVGFELCPEHKKLHDDGYLALVVVTSVKEQVPFIEQYNSAKRTGDLVHIRRTAAKEIFNITIPNEMEMMWIDPEGFAKLTSMLPKND